MAVADLLRLAGIVGFCPRSVTTGPGTTGPGTDGPGTGGPGTDGPGGLRGVLAEARDGLVEVRRRSWVSVVMLQGTVQVFFLFRPNYVLVPMVSQARYGISTFG
ncbi:hypothetical protein GCM10010433_40300 [Streptomyces pulveraceus]